MTSQAVPPAVPNAPSNRWAMTTFPWPTIPYWFAAIAGLVYATGFLVEFTFQHALGITTSLDVFKAKYIYIGLQCLQFPASVVLLLFGFWRNKNKQRELEKHLNDMKVRYAHVKAEGERVPESQAETARQLDELQTEMDQITKDGFRVYFSFTAAMCGLLLVFYLTTTFARPQEWPAMQLAVALLTVFITCLMAFIRVVEKPLAFLIMRFRADSSETASLDAWILKGPKIARTVLLIPECIAIWIICKSQIVLFGVSVLDGGYFYLIFAFLVLLMLAFLVGSLPVFRRYQRAGALFAMNLSVTFSFLYLFILSYAYHVYPYLPVTRGGGDYSADTRVSFLTFTNDSAPSIPEELLERDSLRSKEVTILEDSADTVFVTLEHTEDERKRWRLVGIENKPRVIYSVKKDSVVNIVYHDSERVQPPRPLPRVIRESPLPMPPVTPTSTPTVPAAPVIAPAPSPTATPGDHVVHKTNRRRHKQIERSPRL
ncbi:MAG: hypothetical protein QOE26_1794 [Verrucomicrobiota bacterium]|jgi:hypothetical protein